MRNARCSTRMLGGAVYLPGGGCLPGEVFAYQGVSTCQGGVGWGGVFAFQVCPVLGGGGFCLVCPDTHTVDRILVTCW